MNRRRFVQTSLSTAVAATFLPGHGISAILSPTMAVDTDINAIAGDGRSITLTRAAVQEFGESLRGDLLLSGHPAYEEARHVLNGDIDRYPALIAQCKGVADVKNAVDFARESGLLVAVKCGGHSHSGKSTCDGGIMIDLSTLRSVRVDPGARIAQVSGGSLLGDMDHDTMAFGLVTTAGTVSHTGVGGLTLGGGYGRLARRFGLSLDNLRGVEIITADGEFRRANATENADLFWGLRGGGGNFGVVTSFEFGLHPMDREVVGGTIAFPLNQARDVLSFYADYAMEAPDELSLDLAILNDAEQGSSVAFLICYSGPHNRADAILDTIRRAGTPVLDDVRAVDYVALQKSGDISDPRGTGHYTKSGFSPELSGAFIDAIVAGFEPHPERSTTFYFQHDGGAINRVAADATAFPHRAINLTPLVSVAWPVNSDRAEHVAWAREYWTTIEPFTQGFYTNDLADESQEEINGNYFGNYDRLVALKNRYDPTNLFQLNANILPTA